MDKVYGNSYCNIAAARDVKGLFDKPLPECTPVPTTTCKWSFRLVPYQIVRDDYWYSNLTSAELYSRGWVFQERTLSPRTIHFRPGEVFWECLDGMASQAAPNGIPEAASDMTEVQLVGRRALQQLLRWQQGSEDNDTQPHTERVKLQKIWPWAVKTYSGCNLTMPYDKLMAIASLAKVFRGAFEERYIAGLWWRQQDSAKDRDEDFANQLGWHIFNCSSAKGGSSSRAVQYRAPSWSWASVDGIVMVNSRMWRRSDYCLRFGELPDIKLKNPEVLCGRVEYASLQATGQLLSLKFLPPRDGSPQWLWAGPVKSMVLHPDEHLVERLAMKQCFVLMLSYTAGSTGYSGHAIALEESSLACYSRIGLVEFKELTTADWQALRKSDENDDKNFDDEEARHTITLI